MATRPQYPLLTVEDFLDIDFGGRKAELDNGVIRMMAGGTRRHARVQLNLTRALATRLRGSGCTPYGSDMGVKTGPSSTRYPDVSVFCGGEDPEHDDDKVADDPHVLFEVLSAGTSRTDLTIKVPEYKALPSVDTIVLVDIATERVRLFQRFGRDGWSEQGFDEPVDVPLPSLNVVLSHEEIFARD